MSGTNLEARVDTEFSLYTRLRFADHAGYASCYTCGARRNWRELQCGHWLKRGHHATRWEDDNARPQCWECNNVYGGREDIFEENLRDELGDARVEELKAMAAATKNFSDEELKTMLKTLADRVDKLGKVV